MTFLTKQLQLSNFNSLFLFSILQWMCLCSPPHLSFSFVLFSPEGRISLFWMWQTDRLSLPLRIMAMPWKTPFLRAGSHFLQMSMIKPMRYAGDEKCRAFNSLSYRYLSLVYMSSLGGGGGVGKNSTYRNSQFSAFPKVISRSYFLISWLIKILLRVVSRWLSCTFIVNGALAEICGNHSVSLWDWAPLRVAFEKTPWGSSVGDEAQKRIWVFSEQSFEGSQRL